MVAVLTKKYKSKRFFNCFQGWRDVFFADDNICFSLTGATLTNAKGLKLKDIIRTICDTYLSKKNKLSFYNHVELSADSDDGKTKFIILYNAMYRFTLGKDFQVLHIDCIRD
jgi:hypothetical protein